jgi:hypothetical protein
MSITDSSGARCGIDASLWWRAAPFPESVLLYDVTTTTVVSCSVGMVYIKAHAVVGAGTVGAAWHEATDQGRFQHRHCPLAGYCAAQDDTRATSGPYTGTYEAEVYSKAPWVSYPAECRLTGALDPRRLKCATTLSATAP